MPLNRHATTGRPVVTERPAVSGRQVTAGPPVVAGHQVAAGVPVVAGRRVAVRRRVGLMLCGVLLALCGGAAGPGGAGPTVPGAGVPVAGGAGTGPAVARHPATVVACPQGQGTQIQRLVPLWLPCLSGTGTMSATAVHGRPEVINFWASWCEPCRREAPLLEAVHRAMGDRVLFLGVDSRDERGAALEFLAASGASYPQVFDAPADFARRLGLWAMPVTLFVDASGHVAYRQVGELTRERLREALASLGTPLPPTD